ncbi:MAG: hypothetical protein WBL20_16730 [Sphingobium sp.]
MDAGREYLRRAEEAEAQAARQIGVIRDQLLDVARQWRDLARQAGQPTAKGEGDKKGDLD